MGSLITADGTTMSHVLEVVKELGLFFVDSRTSTQSVVADVLLRGRRALWCEQLVYRQ